MTADQLLNMRQVRERLNVSRSTAFELVLSGELRSCKIGARRLVSESALADYIEQISSAD